MLPLIAFFLTAAMLFPMSGGSFAPHEGIAGGNMINNQAALCGYWYAMPYLHNSGASALYDTRYLFSADGTFIYGCDMADGLNRIRYTAGHWYVAEGKLYLKICEQLVWEGGEEVPADGSIRTKRMIENPAIRLIAYDEPEVEVHDIMGPLSPAELNGPETGGRKVVKIDGQAFYGFGSHASLLDGYWEMKELAVPAKKAVGIPLFEYLADPVLTALALNFETDFPVSVSVRHDGEAGGSSVTVTDPETIRAVFEALCQITVLGEWPVSGHTDDYLYYYFEMTNGRVIYGFEFQSGMLLDGGLGLHEITGFDALQRALPDPGLY